MDKKKSENPNSETSNDMLENLNSDTIYDDDEDFIERIKNKVNKQSWFTDLKICFVVLTRIPIYVGETSNDFSIAEASRFFPITGAVIGLLSVLVFWLFAWFGLPASILALLLLLTMTLLTGALHDDGLADTFDGLGGGIDREEKLSIMRDSSVGSYGIMSLLFSFGLRWAAYTKLIELGFYFTALAVIAVASASRAALPPIMYFIPVAREDGLSARAGKPSLERAVTSVLIGVAVLLFLLGFQITVIAIGLSVLVVGFFVYFVATRIGGQTGDVLGAAQQLTEVTILFAVLIVGIS